MEFHYSHKKLFLSDTRLVQYVEESYSTCRGYTPRGGANTAPAGDIHPGEWRIQHLQGIYTQGKGEYSTCRGYTPRGMENTAPAGDIHPGEGRIQHLQGIYTQGVENKMPTGDIHPGSWLCWGLTSQSTIFQSFRGVKCLAQGHNTAAVGLEPRTSRSGVRHSTTEPPRSPTQGVENTTPTGDIHPGSGEYNAYRGYTPREWRIQHLQGIYTQDSGEYSTCRGYTPREWRIQHLQGIYIRGSG